MTHPAYPNALILAHPQMNAEQACNVARRDGLLLVHNPRTGNYLFESSTQAPDSARTGGVLPAPNRPAAGFTPEAA